MKLSTLDKLRRKYYQRDFQKNGEKLRLVLFVQISSSLKADHYNLKLDNAINAFVSECKKKNSVQLCVYSENKVKQKKYFMEVLL